MPVLLLLLFLLTSALAQSTTPNPPRGEVRALILSDFNGSYGALDYPPPLARVLEAAVRVWRPDLVLSAGDVIAGQSAALPKSRFAEMWGAFDAAVAAPLRAAGIPFAPAVGNHDGSSLRTAADAFVYAREREAARAYWTGQPPALEFHDAADFPFHYSFAAREAFIVVWDASSATIRPEQLEWLAEQLASPAAQAASYRILVGHLPLYGVSEGRDAPGEVLTNGDALRQILENFGLDLYLSGHHAAYYAGRVGGLALLASGGLGARRLLGSDAAPVSSVSVLDLDFDPLRLRLTTFDALSLQELAPEDLPERLQTRHGVVDRLEPLDDPNP